MKLQHGLAAVITGGASGLGAATARALARHGVKVGIIDRDVAEGEALAAEIGGVFARVDVTSDEDVTWGFDSVRAVNGQERVLVNCAGAAEAIKTVRRDRATGAITSYPIENFRRIVEINLIGTFRCIATSAAGMMSLSVAPEGERGVIINTSSIVAQDGQMGQAAYASSKAGVVGLTLPIARDLMGEAIRINTVLPGVFNTPPMAAAPAALRDALVAAVPFPKRLGDPVEYAHMVLAMIENGYLNGESLRLDGAVRFPPK